MLEQQIEQDLKTALLARDSFHATTLRGLKSTLLNVKIASGKRESGLSDDEVIPLLAKEAKKRQESADLYVQGGNQERADAELAEKKIIEKYLPAQLDEAAIAQLVEAAIAEAHATGPAMMGQIISIVRTKANGAADGGVIARIVKEKLQ